MIISTRKRFIFCAFNKTGSTSIENTLRPYNNPLWYRYLRARYKWSRPSQPIFKHIRPYDLRRFLGTRKWDKFFVFSFVRNPWSRAVSLYFFHRKEPDRWPLAQKSFEEWVQQGGTGSVHRSMAEFVSDDDYNPIVDFVGRYENLEADFRRACEQAQLGPIQLPHLNRSTNGDYRKHFSPETRDIVAGWAARDIEMFDYDF